MIMADVQNFTPNDALIMPNRVKVSYLAPLSPKILAWGLLDHTFFGWLV